MVWLESIGGIKEVFTRSDATTLMRGCGGKVWYINSFCRAVVSSDLEV